jgi:hypothetical protein
LAFVSLDRISMAKRAKKRKRDKPTLADDIRASFNEARDYFAGKKTNVIVHTVVPSAAKARKARRTLGLSQPKAVLRALKD